MDVGTSCGVWGLERGYCMMIGGEAQIVGHLDSIFRTLAPGQGNIPRTPGREKLDGTAELGYLHYDFNLRDVAEVWRRGSVIASWLLDLTAAALVEDPGLAKFAGRVSDSGEGRWTIKAAIDEAVPAPVLTAALYERFSSRGEADFANKLLSAMRFQFGGHLETGPGRQAA